MISEAMRLATLGAPERAREKQAAAASAVKERDERQLHTKVPQPLDVCTPDRHGG